MTRADERATATAKVLLVLGGAILAGLAWQTGGPASIVGLLGLILLITGILL